MSKKVLNITYHSVGGREQLSDADRALFDEAIAALDSAYAPYSSFRVGAAVLLANGEVVRGSNQENMAYPSGLCAERVAMFAAASRYPNVAMVALAVVADVALGDGDGSISPCGGCRQVMIEYERKQEGPLRIITGAAGGPITVTEDAASLLPFAFFDPHLAKRPR